MTKLVQVEAGKMEADENQVFSWFAGVGGYTAVILNDFKKSHFDRMKTWLTRMVKKHGPV